MPRGGKRDGAGRKPSPTPNKVTISVRVDPAIVQQLQEEANSLEISRSQLIEIKLKSLM